MAAGAPILAEECIEDYLTFDTQGSSGEHFALKVRGESMLGAGILPGDLVVVHRQPDAYNGEIVVALFEDEATVKTLRRKDGKTWLMPANDAYEPIDGTRAQIIGKGGGRRAALLSFLCLKTAQHFAVLFFRLSMHSSPLSIPRKTAIMNQTVLAPPGPPPAIGKEP